MFSQRLSCLFGKSDVKLSILSLFSQLTNAEFISIGACSTPNLIMYFWQSLTPKPLDISIYIKSFLSWPTDQRESNVLSMLCLVAATVWSYRRSLRHQLNSMHFTCLLK